MKDVRGVRGCEGCEGCEGITVREDVRGCEEEGVRKAGTCTIIVYMFPEKN